MLDGSAKAEQVLPYFIINELPKGVIGIVIAAALAAAMSSLDSSINAISTVFITDIYKRILADLRSGYRLTYQSNSNKPEFEYREIRVEVEERELEVRARRGYQP